MEKTNLFKIVGTLINSDLQVKSHKQNGNQYISGNVTVKANIDGTDCEYDIGFYADQLTAEKKPNKLYQSYVSVGDLIGKKVEISGSFRENRFFSSKSAQMVSLQLLAGKFIKGVPSTTVDVATWELGGFVVSELVEKANKEGEVYRYDLSVAQSNYKDDAISVFTVHGNPTDAAIVNGLRTYHMGDTIIIKGKMLFKVETVTVEQETNGFGEKFIRTYTNKQRNFYVTGGSEVIRNEEQKYSAENIAAFISAYKQRDVELTEAAKSNEGADEVANIAPATLLTPSTPSSRQTDLL